MIIFLNPVLLLFISFLSSFFMDVTLERVFPLLTAIVFTSFIYISLEKKYERIFAIAFFFLCLWRYEFLSYLPLIAYMYMDQRKMKVEHVVWLLPVIVHVQDIDIYVTIIIVLFFFLALALKIQSLRSEKMKTEYQKQRDATKELSLLITEKNKEILIQQEQEIRIATLDERNRIAREIHDNVGHLLSSSLLQIGALQTLEEDIKRKELLQNLRDTLSSAMNTVRNSVHDLHEDSLDLELMIRKLIQTFTFCEVNFEYDITQPFKPQVIYHLLALIKECMNNTMKHSNASILTIIIREQPGFYQVIVKDNGTLQAQKGNGMGLQSMQERIEALQGYINITKKDGFQVFITLAKGDKICAC